MSGTTALAKLREPFAPNQINTLPKPYNKDATKGNCRECGGYHGLPAVHLEYVGHAALTDRFLDADPTWTWEPLAVGQDGLPAFDKLGGLWIRLTVGGVTRLGYGDAQGKTGPNAIKEAIGDALRNAGMRFGAALDLWHKGDLHDSTNPQPEPVAVAAPVEPPPAETEPDPFAADDPTAHAVPSITEAQSRNMHRLFNLLNIKDRDEKLTIVAKSVGRPVASSGELTKPEADALIKALKDMAGES